MDIRDVMKALGTAKELWNQVRRVKRQVNENAEEIKALRQDVKKLIRANKKLVRAISSLSATTTSNEEKNKDARDKLALTLENQVLKQMLSLQSQLRDSERQLRSADLPEDSDDTIIDDE